MSSQLSFALSACFIAALYTMGPTIAIAIIGFVLLVIALFRTIMPEETDYALVFCIAMAMACFVGLSGMYAVEFRRAQSPAILASQNPATNLRGVKYVAEALVRNILAEPYFRHGPRPLYPREQFERVRKILVQSQGPSAILTQFDAIAKAPDLKTNIGAFHSWEQAKAALETIRGIPSWEESRHVTGPSAIVTVELGSDDQLHAVNPSENHLTGTPGVVGEYTGRLIYNPAPLYKIENAVDTSRPGSDRYRLISQEVNGYRWWIEWTDKDGKVWAGWDRPTDTRDAAFAQILANIEVGRKILDPTGANRKPRPYVTGHVAVDPFSLQPIHVGKVSSVQEILLHPEAKYNELDYYTTGQMRDIHILLWGPETITPTK